MASSERGRREQDASPPVSHDIIVVGASAGGVEALKQLVAGLPAEFPAALFIVLHLPPGAASVLPQILDRACRLPASHATNAEDIEPGRIYVAPPDHHMVLEEGSVWLNAGPLQNGHRPAIDPLFSSAALHFKKRVIGVVLSGVLDDGTMGLKRIKNSGGISIVQDPEDALYSGMPRSAIAADDPDHIMAVADIPKLIAELVVAPHLDVSGESSTGIRHAGADEALAVPSELTCPDCGGALWMDDKARTSHFRCRVGHAFSLQSLVTRQSQSAEQAVWVALRALEESAALARRVADQVRRKGHGGTARQFDQKSSDAAAKADALRRLLMGGDALEAERSADALSAPPVTRD